MKLKAYRLTPDAHPYLIERLRTLYNSAIQFLATHPIELRSREAQAAWWNSTDHDKVTVHLYSPVDNPWEIAAFSMVTDRGSFVTPMFAIAKNYWGKGYGEEIILHYLALAGGKPLRGEQLISNGAICHLNEKLGWQVLMEKEGTQFLFHPNIRQQEVYDEIVRYNDEGSTY